MIQLRTIPATGGQLQLVGKEWTGTGSRLLNLGVNSVDETLKNVEALTASSLDSVGGGVLYDPENHVLSPWPAPPPPEEPE
jgi:hypothetical protein